MDTPKESPAPVVVTPIHPEQSRTLKLTNILTWLSSIVALLPSVLAFFVELMGDPEIAAAISGFIPAKYRVPFGLIMIAIAQRYGHLRKVTEAPIAGTPTAENALPLISPSQVAAARTKEKP